MIAIVRLVLTSMFVAIAGVAVSGSAMAIAAADDTAAIEIALTNGGESWWVSTLVIERRSATSEVLAVTRTDASGIGPVVAYAVSPHDDSLWVVTDARQLVHLGGDGAIVGVTGLAETPASLAVAQDGTVWMVMRGQVQHHARDGRLLGSLPVGDPRDGSVGAPGTTPATELAAMPPGLPRILVDSLRDRIWIVEGLRLSAYALDHDDAAPVVTRRPACALRTAALDELRGTVFTLCDRTITMFDAAGAEVSQLPLDDDASEALDRLVHDPQSGDLIATGANTALRVRSDGGLKLRGHVDPALAAVRPAPFRIDPAIVLLRPPDGGATPDAQQEIVLALGARCPSGDCPTPESYVQRLQIVVEVNGVRQPAPTIDRRMGRAALSAGDALRPGTNRIDGEAHDRFGHVGRMPTASLTLLADSIATPGSETLDGPVAERTAKASNKPPTVALTAPPAGAVFGTGTDITLTANAKDSDGAITRVEFFRAKTRLIGTATAPPYSIVWPKAIAGTHSLTARAWDNRKASTTSTPVTIKVVNNKAPSVTLTTPSDGEVFTAGDPITLTAKASDTDGSVATLEFLDGGTTLAMLHATPWTWSWIDATPGAHAIAARATDDRGAISTSAVVNLTVEEPPEDVEPPPEDVDPPPQSAGEPPRVIIAKPASCAVMEAFQTLVVTVDAYSATSAIATVDVFDGSVLVASETRPPWVFGFANPSVGTHSITARATDRQGLATTSQPIRVDVRAPNQLPTVTITAPADGATYPSGATITLSASASDPDGSITSVVFQADGPYPIGTATLSPYSIDWKGVTSGTHTVHAYAIDDRGGSNGSAPVQINVAANVLPTVYLTSPTNGSVFSTRSTIGLSAAASDDDGAIVRVEFYDGLILIGSDTTAPFTFDWRTTATGNHSLTALAYDNSGAVAASETVSVFVAANLLPTIALTTPVAGSDQYAPATIALGATASDPDGGVTRVEFRANGLLIGTSTSTPYRVTWSNVAAGTYSVTATAYDGNGGSATTPSTVIIVKPPVSLTLVDPADGATIADDRVRIRGRLSGPDNSSITVNGVVAHVDDEGAFQLNDVPLSPGVNTVEAIVTTQDGQTASRSLTVASSGPGAFAVDASPTEGIESLAVTFTIENRQGLPFKEVSLDLDGDGHAEVVAAAEQFVDGSFSSTTVFPVGTWNAVVRVMDDGDRMIYETQKSIVVLAPERYGSRIRAVYEQMLTRLGAGNVSGALTAFASGAYARYEQIFNDLASDLPTVAGQVGALSEMTFNLDVAELGVVRQTPDGPQQFMVYLMRSEDGIWRIDGM